MNLVFKIFIPKIFPALNDILSVRTKDKKFGWNDVKRKCEEAVSNAALAKYIPASMFPLVGGPYRIVFIWHEWNMKRDLDGVSAGAKPILDAMQELGIFKNDGWHENGETIHRPEIAIDEAHIGVTVEVWEDDELRIAHAVNCARASKRGNVPDGYRIVSTKRTAQKRRRPKRAKKMKWGRG